MAHFVFLVAALGLVLLANAVSRMDQVYGISLYGASLFTGLWGFLIAPISAQISLELFLFGWVQFRFLRS